MVNNYFSMEELDEKIIYGGQLFFDGRIIRKK